MKKKIYCGLLVTFVLVLSLGLFSTSYAMSKSEAFEYCRDNSGFSTLFNTTGNPGNSAWYSYDAYKSYLDNKTEDIFYVVKSNNSAISSTSATFEIRFYDNLQINNDIFTVTNNTSYKADRKTVNQSSSSLNFYRIGAGNTVDTGTYNLIFPTEENTFYMLYANGQILAASFSVPSAINFDPGNDIITVGDYNNVHLTYWWPTTYVTWGILSGYNKISPDLLSYALIRVYPNGDEEVVINPFIEPWYLISLGEYYWESSQRRIYTDSLYKLLIDYNGDLQTFYFYVVPRGSSIVNGSTIPFNWNSGDSTYTTQNQTNDLINEATDMSSIDNTKEELLESGELFKRLNYQVYPNHSYEILFAMTRNLCDTLYYSGDTYIDISIGDWYTHRFYSSDFYIPVNGLTYWIYMALIFGYCYLLYRQASELIHAIQEGDLYVLELEDANEYFYM